MFYVNNNGTYFESLLSILNIFFTSSSVSFADFEQLFVSSDISFGNKLNTIIFRSDHGGKSIYAYLFPPKVKGLVVLFHFLCKY